VTTFSPRHVFRGSVFDTESPDDVSQPRLESGPARPRRERNVYEPAVIASRNASRIRNANFSESLCVSETSDKSESRITCHRARARAHVQVVVGVCVRTLYCIHAR